MLFHPLATRRGRAFGPDVEYEGLSVFGPSSVQRFPSTPEQSSAEILFAHPSWGRAVHIYETKIISRSGNVSLQVAADYLNDLAAIRAARTLCSERETAEVWRDDICIYSEHPKPIRLVWPAASERPAG